MALRYADHGYILESGRTSRGRRRRRQLRENEDVREFYLGTGQAGAATARAIAT